MPGPHIFANANPTGLMGKSANLAALGQASATIAVQETHLTAQGISRFRKELAWQKTGLNMTHGAPAPPKNQSLRTMGGKQTGVAYISHHPIRNLVHHWSSEDYASGRCLASAAYINKRWVTMGTVYGFNEGAHSIEVQQHTDRLLTGLTTRVVDGAHGLRMVSGDWNLERTNIPQADYWESKGWIEAQQLAAKKWHRPRMCTCKRTTVKDFLYLSPEVIPYVEDIQLDWSSFADHAVILVHLSDIDAPPKVPMWRKPKPIQWTKPQQHSSEWVCLVQPTHDMDQWYQAIWADAEDYANHLNKSHGLPKLLPHQTGRASTKEVVWTNSQAAPVKPNRKGDIQSELASTNMTHARWTKQVRRLQHYARAASSESTQMTLAEHKASLWRKIRQATGFQHGFDTWWNQLDKVFPSSPLSLPFGPPAADVALGIFEEFAYHYRALEKSLMKARHEYAKQRRTKDPMLIYRDLQRDRAEPVQTIVQNHTIAITSRREIQDQVHITLQEPLPEGFQSVTINQIPVQIAQTDQNEFAIPAETAAQLKNEITLRKNTGDIGQILEAFESEWAPRWQKHDNIDHTKWDTIIDFFKTALPERKVEFPPITATIWRRAVNNKRKGAAVGPDGVAKADLQALPDSTLQQLLDMIQSIEIGYPWPSQAITGLVAALAKKPNSEETKDFRPITIYSMVYRTWSSIRGRQCLQFLQSIVPHTLLGNIPGRSPKKLWFHIQQRIEHAYGNDSEVAGTVIDLVKCFNTLPRQVLQKLAQHIGIPDTVIGPWNQALDQMTRRFQVRGATGRPISSSTGYPEGCALSVVAMVVCNLGLEIYMYHRYPKVQTWSFVDNIEVLANSAKHAIEALEGLLEFSDLLDLQIDMDKSYLWCNTPSGRKAIQEAGCTRKYFARDLGGHMNYTKLCTNASIQEKIQALTSFWSRLARSCAPNSQKERSLYVCAWPNLFYGISTVTLGNNHFLKLRTLATKSLNVHQMGSNPALQLSCVCHPLTDPEFYCVHATILSFRDFCTPDLAQHTLEAILRTGATTPGPCKSFLQAIHKLAWQWIGGDACLDQDQLPIHILRCPRGELSERIMLAWQQRILSQVAMERTTMSGLYNMDAKLTKELYRQQPAEHQGLLRCALNGTQYTQDALHHAGKTDSADCKFCGLPDSLEHRNMHCPFFQEVRDMFPDAAMPPDAPDATKCHGWIPKAENLHEFRRELLQIPDTTGDFCHPVDVPCNVTYADVFIDGSCVRPHDAHTRLATWGVVTWDGFMFVSVSSGGIIGWRQTSLRAEITAALSALKYLASQPKQGRIWVDNQQVFDMLQAWQLGYSPEIDKRRDADLWTMLRYQFKQISFQIHAIYKVRAHTIPSDQLTPEDAWATEGNHAADACAAFARATLPSALIHAVTKLVPEMQALRTFGRALHSMLVAIGLKALESKCAPEAPVMPAGTGIQPHPTVELDGGIQHLAELAVDDIPKKFHVKALPAVLSWLKTLTVEGNVMWISFHQLLVDFQKFSQMWGPASTGKKWIDPPTGELYNYKHYVQWFSRYLQGLGKITEHPLLVQQCRPSSHILTFWCGHVRVRVTTERLNQLDDFFKIHAANLPVRQINKDLGATPPWND